VPKFSIFVLVSSRIVRYSVINAYDVVLDERVAGPAVDSEVAVT